MPPYARSLYDELASIKGDHKRIYLVFRSILDAVRYAHGEGVIHRDLKPENVLINSDNDLVVSDFGLGRILDSKSTRMTMTGARLGTVLYCAPEQMRDFKCADQRSDVFSLGRMLYELYSGELTTAIQDLSTVPAPLAGIVEKATATNSDHRYQSIEKMLAEFDSTMEVLLGIVEAGSLEDLLETLRSAKSWDDQDVTKLSVLLENAKDEPDVIHSAMMRLPAELFARVADRSRSLGRQLVQIFCEYLRSQAWPFSHTDTIAGVCAGLYRELSDPEMHAELFKAVLIVGHSHNRWYVMSVAASLLESAHEAGDIAMLARVIKENSSESEALSGYVNRAKLHPAIRTLIPKSTAEV